MRTLTTAPFQEGDRIELVSMPNDPCPIAPGTRGVVKWCEYHVIGQKRFWQVCVTWDANRSLMLVIPPDVAQKVA